MVGIQQVFAQFYLVAGVFAAFSGFQLDEAMYMGIKLFGNNRLLDLVVGSGGITCL